MTCTACLRLSATESRFIKKTLGPLADGALAPYFEFTYTAWGNAKTAQVSGAAPPCCSHRQTGCRFPSLQAACRAEPLCSLWLVLAWRLACTHTQHTRQLSDIHPPVRCCRAA